MKKILSTLLILASILHAQIGIGRNLEGVRVPTANTLEQGFLFISGSYETINDGHALAMNGYSPAGTDSIYELDKNTPSSGGAISLAFGVTDNFEFGASLPLYYEGEIEGTDLDGFGIGDFLAYLKYSYPIPSTPVNVGFLIEATAPTGAKGIGFRPRHQWYIYEDEDSYAFTAGKWALLFEGLLSININDILYCSFAAKAMELKRRAWRSLHIWKNRKVAEVTLTRDDFREVRGTKADAEDVIEIPRQVARNEIALFFYQIPDRTHETRVSIRTREPHDATVLATHFGGGGHLRAAGCTVKGGMAIAKRQVRKAVREMLEGKLKMPEEPVKDKGAGPNGT